MSTKSGADPTTQVVGTCLTCEGQSDISYIAVVEGPIVTTAGVARITARVILGTMSVTARYLGALVATSRDARR